MAIFKCKMCGGELVLQPNSVIAECAYCGTTQTVPSADSEKKLTLFNRANRLRYGCEFDRAAGVYESIIADFPEEAEAYWGLVLCKFGIEYVDDPATGRKIPTCHRSSFESVFDDNNFDQTLENADVTARRLYREEAKLIEELRKGIIAVSSKEIPYDVFICYKETAENGERTLDSVLAQDVYNALTDRGYRVFFSRITLEDKLGQEYEPYIFAALTSAPIMLVFGTDYEYFNAVWVRNEWSRYLELISRGERKTLIPCYKDIDPYDLPKEFGKLQAQDMSKIGAIQDLVRGVEKLIDPGTTVTAKESGIDVEGLLARGMEALEEGDWDAATSRFDLTLVANPKCAEAHVGKLMAERKVKERCNLAKSCKKLESSQNYREALRCAPDSLKEELLNYSKKISANRRRRTIIRICACFAAILTAVTVCFALLVVKFERAAQSVRDGAENSMQAAAVIGELKWLRQTESEELYWYALKNGDIAVANEITPDELKMNHITLAQFLENKTKLHLDNVKKIVLSEGILSVNVLRMSNIPKLEEFIILNPDMQVEQFSFKNCTSLKKIEIPPCEIVEGNAFLECTALEEVSLPEGLKTIYKRAFMNCTALKEVQIPDTVTRIGDSAFFGCTSLKKVMIPASVTNIGEKAFCNLSPDTVICCEASEKPVGWDVNWTSTEATVIWGTEID